MASRAFQTATIVDMLGIPLDAVGDGSTDDSAAFTANFAARRNVTPAPGKSYSVKNLLLSHSDSIEGNNAIFVSEPGGSHMFRLEGTDPRVGNFRISSNVGAAAAIRIAASRGARVRDISGVNLGYGFLELNVDDPADIIALSILADLQGEQIDTVGVYIGENVSEIRGGNIHMHGALVAGTGGLKPASGTIGWRQYQPLIGSIARGGHQLAKLNMIAFETGYHFTDVELLTYSDMIADSCSGFGVIVDGTGGNKGVKFCNLFVGTSRGLKVAGTADIHVAGLDTFYNGSVFFWMASDFYTGTAYDVTLADTAKLTISGYWRGDKKLNIASTAKLVIECGEKFRGRSIGTVAAASTGYLAEFGITGTEGDATWRAPCSGRLVGITTRPTAAPGAGQTFTYTLRKNFADTTQIATVSGDSDFGGDYWSTTGGTAYADGETIAIKLVTSATAAATRHNVALHFVPD